MPNWCENELKVQGSESELERFRLKAKSEEDKSKDVEATDLSLNNFIPMPAEMLQGEKWYIWRVDNWGIKWDVKAYYDGGSKGCIYYNFDSPWSAPLTAIKKISEQFPELIFKLRYEEEGMGFAGVFLARGGDIIVDECYNISYGICPRCNAYASKTIFGRCSSCDEIITDYGEIKEKSGE